MAEGWRRIFDFYARDGILDPTRAAELSTEERLREFTELPETLAILEQELSAKEEAAHARRARSPTNSWRRAESIAGHLTRAALRSS